MLFYKNYVTTMFIVLESMCVPNFIVGYCVSELHGPYRNVLPEAVCCCFTGTILFTCLYDQS